MKRLPFSMCKVWVNYTSAELSQKPRRNAREHQIERRRTDAGERHVPELLPGIGAVQRSRFVLRWIDVDECRLIHDDAVPGRLPDGDDDDAPGDSARILQPSHGRFGRLSEYRVENARCVLLEDPLKHDGNGDRRTDAGHEIERLEYFLSLWMSGKQHRNAECDEQCHELCGRHPQRDEAGTPETPRHAQPAHRESLVCPAVHEKRLESRKIIPRDRTQIIEIDIAEQRDERDNERKPAEHDESYERDERKAERRNVLRRPSPPDVLSLHGNARAGIRANFFRRRGCPPYSGRRRSCRDRSGWERASLRAS